MNLSLSVSIPLGDVDFETGIVIINPYCRCGIKEGRHKSNRHPILDDLRIIVEYPTISESPSEKVRNRLIHSPLRWYSCTHKRRS